MWFNKDRYFNYILSSRSTTMSEEETVFHRQEVMSFQGPTEEDLTRGPDPDLESKVGEYTKQLGTLSKINSLYNTVAPVVLTWMFWRARQNIFVEDCQGPGYTWSLIACIYYFISSVIAIRKFVKDYLIKEDKSAKEIPNTSPFKNVELYVALMNCVLYPAGVIISFVLILALLWSDTCPDLSGTLWVWLIVQLCSWLSCCLCCGIGGYSGFDLIKQEISKAEKMKEKM